MHKNMFPCLWLEQQAKEAAAYYCSVFPNSKITGENPFVVNFELNGQHFMTLNGNRQHPLNESVSFVIPCAGQEEIDYYWNKLTGDGGQESMCGWLKDKYGVSWQVVPENIGELLMNPANGGRAMQALMQMKKIDIAALQNA